MLTQRHITMHVANQACMHVATLQLDSNFLKNCMRNYTLTKFASAREIDDISTARGKLKNSSQV